jgi:hypothetical protein
MYVKPPGSFPSPHKTRSKPHLKLLESLTKQTASSAFPVFTTRDSTEELLTQKGQVRLMRLKSLSGRHEA